jgi:RNA polymerase sigma factor (sigma-70 family)
LCSNQGELELLISELKQGSISAFRKFYEQYLPLVYKIAYNLLKDRMEAEDLCHDIFLEAINKIDHYDSSRGSMDAWLAVLTRSRGLDRLRRRKREAVHDHARLMEICSEERVDLSERVLSRLEHEFLSKSLGRIPEPQRRALYGSYFFSQSHKEIANAMNMPLGTIKSLIRYGIQNLRNQFLKQGWIESTGRGEKNDR